LIVVNFAICMISSWYLLWVVPRRYHADVKVNNSQILLTGGETTDLVSVASVELPILMIRVFVRD